MRILLLLFLFPFGEALSCAQAPEKFYFTADKMYWLSKEILLGKVIEQQNLEGVKSEFGVKQFRFEVVEVLRGDQSTKSFSLEGFSYKKKAIDFNSHEDFLFWGNSFAGNSTMPGDCRAYGKFEIGNTYLIFSDLNHPKAFELIKNKNDRWYKLIKYIVESNKNI